VRLGIAGPAEIPVYREEIWLAVQAENQAAAKSAANALPADLPSQAGAHGNGPATKITAAPVDEPAPADEPAPVDDTDPAV
jgi:hypothetical protein